MLTLLKIKKSLKRGVFKAIFKLVKAGAKNEISKSEPVSLDYAINDLVKALKRDLEKKYGRIDYARLHRDGYSDFLLVKLRQV
jgi:hypothetical protein